MYPFRQYHTLPRGTGSKVPFPSVPPSAWQHRAAQYRRYRSTRIGDARPRQYWMVRRTIAHISTRYAASR
eukprot:903636-Rhodomonas_salina.1